MTTGNNKAARDVNIQDQHSRTGNSYFSQAVATPIALAVDAVIDDWSFTAAAGHNIVAGDQLIMFDTVSQRLYIGGALTPVGDVIPLDTPLNFSYPAISSFVQRTTKEMNVDGSTNRQTFSISPPIDVQVDITSISFEMITTDFPELDMFGDLAGGLARGLVFRVVNGINVNYFNVKQNGDFSLLDPRVNYFEAAKHGLNGISGHIKYAGQSEHGVVIRLAQNDSLEVIVQDDLTANTASIKKLRMMAAFHEVV